MLIFSLAMTVSVFRTSSILCLAILSSSIVGSSSSIVGRSFMRNMCVRGFCRRNFRNQRDVTLAIQQMESVYEEDAASPSAALWSTKQESVPSVLFATPTIELGKNLFYGPKAAVYEIAHHPDWVIKYNRFEEGKYVREPVDPVLREAFFLEYLKSDHVTNGLLYYSGALEGDVMGKGKLPSSSDAVRPYRSRVRYIITEKIGRTLADYRGNGTVRVEAAARLGIQMMGLLERLHARNVIHGDLHLGNLGFSFDGRLVLIDFGMARIVDPLFDFSSGGETTPRDRMYRHLVGWNDFVGCTDPFQSQWEDRYILASFRDDVYRALFAVASLATGIDRELEPVCALWRMCSDSNCLGAERLRLQDEYMRIKEGNFLEGKTELVVAHFARALELVRTTPIASKPDYDAIAEELLDIVRAAQGRE